MQPRSSISDCQEFNLIVETADRTRSTIIGHFNSYQHSKSGDAFPSFKLLLIFNHDQTINTKSVSTVRFRSKTWVLSSYH